MHRWLAWNVFFPLQEWLKGHPTLRILKEMEAADLLTADQLERLRERKVRDFLQYGYAHVPYVRNIMRDGGLNPSDIRGPADLAHFPLMRKADVRQHRDQLRSDIAGKISTYSTGGSTGEPLIYDLPMERLASWLACRQRVMRWWGLSVGDKEIALWGSPVELTKQDRVRTVRDWLLATRLLSAFETNDELMAEYLDILTNYRCRTMYAYPSSIYRLCLYARKQGRNLRKLGIKTVFVTSEVLFPYQREVITETLNCPVANGYGGRDSGFISHECPQGGMHLMADATIVEIVDSAGRPAPFGESGEIVVTDLYSREVPFIRYATGDMGALSSRRCSCGLPLPLLESLDGRANDCIVAPDGRVMHAQGLIGILEKISGVEQFRIHQKQTDEFHVQIVRNENYAADSEDRIREGWTKRLRVPLQLKFEYVASLPVERSGKFRHVISDVATGQISPEGGGPRR
jgi:phenylacetate-CoA ligase